MHRWPVLLALVTVAILAAPARGATVAYGPPVALGPGALADVAINARGQAVAVLWDDDGVLVADRDAAGRWTPARRLRVAGPAPARPATCIRDPRVALDRRGRAVVTWTQNRGCYDGPTPVLLSAARTAAGRWAPARRIGRAWWPVRLGMGDDGAATVAWTGPVAVWTATGRAGRWAAPVRIAEPPPAHSEAALDVHPGGRAVLAWGETAWEPATQRGTSRLLVAERAPDGTWTPPVTVPGAEELVPSWSTLPLRASLAADGQVVVAWTTEVNAPGEGARLGVVERDAAGSWRAPRTLTRAASGTAPWLDLNDEGEAVLGWAASTPGKVQTPFGEVFARTRAVARTRSADGTWSAPSRLSRPGSDAYYAAAAIAPGGEVFTAWPVIQRGSGAEVGVDGRMGAPLGRWSGPVAISSRSTGPYGFDVRLATAAGPRAVVAWTQASAGRVTAVARVAGPAAP